jgi:hypothetical protein
MMQFEVVISDRHTPNKEYYRVPIEADFESKGKTIAGHILRGACVKHDDFSLLAYLIDIKSSSGYIVGIARCVKNAVHQRGPNLIKIDGILRTRTPEDKRERKAAQPLINRVYWS